MLSSSILNTVTFKDLTAGTIPNKWNTLHENRKHGGFYVKTFCQRFNKDGVLYLQFTSDSSTDPILKSYINGANYTIALTSSATYGDRYFFNYSVTLGAAYYDKKIYFIITQGTDVLTSEPIFCEDLSADIAAGILKYVKYSNSDRNNSDLSDYFIDWETVSYMYFYIEASDLEVSNMDEVEVLEGSQSKTIISANLFSGLTLKTGGIPDYFVLKLSAASSLDVFEVNGIQYIKEGGVSAKQFGQSTLFEVEIKLTEKNTIGLNVDDLGTESTQINDNMAFDNKRNTAVNGSGWAVENKLGYFVHIILIKHASTSAGDAVVTCGTTPGGNDLIDEEMGNLPLSMYSSTSVPASFPLHSLKNQDVASNIYFSVSGAGAILDISTQFISLIPTT